MSSENVWYHRGKYARLEGKERTINDGRITSENRQQFYSGWDYQDRAMQPKLTPQQEQETNESLAGIREFLAAQGFKSSTKE